MPSLVIPPVIGGVGDTNLTASSRSGTTVTANGTAHTKGSYSPLIDPTTKPSYGIWVRLKGVSTSNTNTSMLVDIAYGPTGGGNEEILILDLDAGFAAGTAGEVGKLFYFPVYIPTGVRVSARSQAVIGLDTVSVAVWLNQDPAYRWACGAVTTYGEDESASCGTSVTPGSGSFGSWTQIGAGTDPVRAHRFWAVGYSAGADTSIAAADVVIEIGTGPDSSNVTTIGHLAYGQTSAEAIHGPLPLIVYGPVVAGGELWARIASAETEARRVIIYGCD